MPEDSLICTPSEQVHDWYKLIKYSTVIEDSLIRFIYIYILVLGMTLNCNPGVPEFEEDGVPLSCHYSQVYSGPEW